MSAIKNVIFDFDGTLVDTAPLIIGTMQETMRQMDLPEKTVGDCRATIGLRLEEIAQVLWPEREGLGAEYAQNYRRIFDQLKRPFKVNCFPDVIDVLNRLRDAGLQMAIASSRSHKSLAEYVELFGLGDCFRMLVGGDDVANGKPEPDPVLSITESLGWDVSETLTVGDAAVDVLMGKSAGTMTCAVTYGNGSESELEAACPDYMISGFSGLIKIVS